MGLLSKKKDILSEKWENLSKLSGRAEIAIGVVTSTIQSLETINQEIDKQIEEIAKVLSTQYTCGLADNLDKFIYSIYSFTKEEILEIQSEVK